MARQTFVFTAMPDPGEPGLDVQETWSVLTHETEEEWWSEVLDGHQHPYVRKDEYGYDTVQKFFGDTVEESRQAALRALEDLVRRKGGRVVDVAEG